VFEILIRQPPDARTGKDRGGGGKVKKRESIIILTLGWIHQHSYLAFFRVPQLGRLEAAVRKGAQRKRGMAGTEWINKRGKRG